MRALRIVSTPCHHPKGLHLPTVNIVHKNGKILSMNYGGLGERHDHLAAYNRDGLLQACSNPAPGPASRPPYATFASCLIDLPFLSDQAAYSPTEMAIWTVSVNMNCKFGNARLLLQQYRSRCKGHKCYVEEFEIRLACKSSSLCSLLICRMTLEGNT